MPMQPPLRSAEFPRLACLPVAIGFYIALLMAAGAKGKPSSTQELQDTIEDLKPGLLAVYRSETDATATLSRIEPKPTFSLGDSSPHPRLPAGPFEVTWTGMLLLRDPSPITFDALVGGELTMEVDGLTVLKGRGLTDQSRLSAKATLKRKPGICRLKIHFRNLAGVPARLQISWEGPTFAREPLPSWRLFHSAKELPESARKDQLAERGRLLVGKLGCARCHSAGLPGVTEPPPGPSLADMSRRVPHDWLLHWLDDPGRVRAGANMPALFAADRQGFVERWLLADYLTPHPGTDQQPKGDHRSGRLAFLGLGCAACHLLPDLPKSEQPALDRLPLIGLAERLPPDDLAAFLGNPHSRYPDGRMPRLPVSPDAARDIAAYLLMWSGSPAKAPQAAPPAAEEINAALRRLGAGSRAAAAATLLREKGCIRCHTGLGATTPAVIRLRAGAERGCLTGESGVHFQIDETARQAILAYLAVAANETHPSSFADRQRQLARAGCVRCHQRDSDRPPPIEEAGSTLGGAFHMYMPFQRTPRLNYPHQKYHRSYLLQAVREGASGLRPERYTYRMPAYGTEAESVVRALAEADGELPEAADPPPPPAADPTAGSLHGPSLVGFQGYACISCHVWNKQTLSESDPGAVGPDLTHTAGRIRRDWFDRFLDDPARSHPFTPMPSVFRRGQPALLGGILGGDAARQKAALWSYFALGPKAPTPKPLPPVPVAAPAANQPHLVAQIPIHLPSGQVVESICMLTGANDLLICDLAAQAPHSLYAGGQIVHSVQGRLRKFHAAGTLFGKGFLAGEPLVLRVGEQAEAPTAKTLRGYERLADGVRMRWQPRFPSGVVEVEDTLRLPAGPTRQLLRELRLTGVRRGARLQVKGLLPQGSQLDVKALTGDVSHTVSEGGFAILLTPAPTGEAAVSISWSLPPADPAPDWQGKVVVDSGLTTESLLERAGYKAIAYPRPKTVSGEDRVMPGALAVHPRDGRVFIASLKTGELLVLRDPKGNGEGASFENYGHGLFQDALSMLADADALYVLHRRNLTRIPHAPVGNPATCFQRLAALPHGVADTYDYAYGLARDPSGGFVLSYAPYANATLPGSGGAVRLAPGQEPRELAFGMRNPLGWCAGPEGEIFFTDNQGEWVASNKLCHLVEGRYYGFPNPAQRQHTRKPAGQAAVWVPYGWARSVNGLAYDGTGGQFGPFAGQFFLAELMFGGAIIRASVERVNGQYQGACFPFWGKGLLGPVTLAFDPNGPLYVGGITEPGWMAMPDRGALFRIDYTGQLPFEMQTIQVRPRGYRIRFTKPVDPATAGKPAAYQVESFRYEHTGAYGSPELDRARVPVERAELSADGASVELTTALVKDRVYLLSAPGVRSAQGETLVHPTGAYTLNEIPK